MAVEQTVGEIERSVKSIGDELHFVMGQDLNLVFEVVSSTPEKTYCILPLYLI